jgi:hypothetical protein
VIVHGTNTLSYKVKIRAKDQCFLPPLKDFKRDAGSQHNYFFQNRLRMIHRFPPHFLSGFTKNLNWLETGSVFWRNVFFFLLYALAQTATGRCRMSPIFVLETGQKPDHRISFRREKKALTWQ